MKCYLTLMILSASIWGNSQSFFQSTIAENFEEANSTYQVKVDSGRLYVSGNYFDSENSWWNVFFSEIDTFGNPKQIFIPSEGFFEGINICNRMVKVGNKFSIVGGYGSNDKIVTFNTETKQIQSTFEFDIFEEDFNASTIGKNIDGDILISGNSIGDKGNIKLAILKDSIYAIYENVTPFVRSRPTKPFLNPINGDIYLLGTDVMINRENKCYLIILDSDLNLKYSSRGTENEFNFDFASWQGILLDDGYIYFSGQSEIQINNQIEYVSKIGKMDTLGKVIWIKPFIESVNNFEGWGAWNDLVVANEDDGIVAVGSHHYSTDSNDTTIVSATIVKISREGELKWSEKFSFREADNRIYNIFYDIESTGSDGYFVGGRSINNSAPSDEILDPPGFRSILLKVNNSGKFERNMTSLIEYSVKKLNIEVYPNPAENYIYISGKSCKGLNAKLFSTTGQLIAELLELGVENKIDLDRNKIESGLFNLVFYKNNYVLGSESIYLK